MYATTSRIFRKMDRLQDAMVRAAMPRVAASEQRPVPPSGAQPRLVRSHEAQPVRLTFTLAEVAASA
jgi:hypothetical protein